MVHAASSSNVGNSSGQRLSERLLEAAAGSFLIGLLTAVGVEILRIGFVPHHDVIATSLVWLAFMLFAPLALMRRLAATPSAEALLYAPCCLLGFTVLIAASFLGTIGTVILGCAALAAAVTLRAGWAIARWKSWRGLGRWVMLLLVGILLVIDLAGTKYGSFIADIVAEYGRASNDIYFHWSLANALRWFGSVGIGVDGVIPVTYYPTVHWLAVRFAEATAADIGIAFIVLRAVFLVPLMLAGFAALSLVMDWTARLRGATALALLIVMALVVSALHLSAFDSESFTLGLLLFSWGAVALCSLGEAAITSRGQRIAAWVSVILLLVVMSLCKSSVGLIFLCLAGYLDLRRNWRRPVLMIGLGALLLAVGGFTLYLVAPRGAAGVGQDGIASNFAIAVSPLQPLVIYGSAIGAVILGLLAAGGFKSFWRDLRNGRTLRFELTAGCIAASTVPALIFVMVDGGAEYFTAVQAWWCFAVVLGLLPAASARVTEFVEKVMPRSDVARRFATAALYLVPVILLLINVGSLVKDRGRQAIAASLLVRTHDLSYYTDDKKRIVRDDVRRGGALLTEHSFWYPADTSAPAGPLVDTLQELHQRYGTALAAYASPENRSFWDLRPSCPGKPMLLFGLTSVPLLDGLPPLWTECVFDSRAIYGLEAIPARQNDAPLDDGALCQRAKARGFTLVYRIEDLAALEDNRLVSCS